MKSYAITKSIIDDKELNSLDVLEEKYNKIVKPGIISKTTKKAIPKIAIGAGALLSSLIDGKQMKTILEYADIFYQKRFILEKEYRIKHTKKYKQIQIIKIGIISLIYCISNNYIFECVI